MERKIARRCHEAVEINQFNVEKSSKPCFKMLKESLVINCNQDQTGANGFMQYIQDHPWLNGSLNIRVQLSG